MSGTFELTVRLSNGTRVSIDVGDICSSEVTVLQVKQKLVGECPVDRQRLIYKGRILEDDRTLQDYGIVPKSTLFLVKGGGPGTPAAPAASATTANRSNVSNATSSSVSNPTPSSFRDTPISSNSQNPWASGTAGSGSNSMLNNSLMGGMNPMTLDPAQMQEMMNSPLMSSLLDNPQMMQSMMEFQMQSNPAMRRVLENNPALRQMMSDPAVLQQVSQMMRNPAALQQAMRNQDLAMSNIENMPGGFAALSNMYRDIQEPLEESMRNNPQPTSSNTANSNRRHFDAGASGSAMPNPWGDNTARTNRNNSSTTTPGNNSWAASATSGTNPLSSIGAASEGNPFASMMGQPPFGMPPSQNGIEAALNLLENPLVRQMMEQAVNQNPEMFRQMLAAQNPLLGQMFENNPEMTNSLFRNMTNPDFLRNVMQVQQALGTGMAMPQQQQTPAQLDFGSLLQQMNNTGLNRSSTAPSPLLGPSPSEQAPADRYRNQLRSLYDMGFDDEQMCLAALQAAHGNLNRAVDLLLSGDLPPLPSSVQTNATAGLESSAPNNGNQNTESKEDSTTNEDNNNAPPKGQSEKKND